MKYFKLKRVLKFKLLVPRLNSDYLNLLLINIMKFMVLNLIFNCDTPILCQMITKSMGVLTDHFDVLYLSQR